MGTFGTGNFDSDATWEILDAVGDVINPEIEGFAKSDTAGVEDLEQVLACIAIKNALVAKCGDLALPQSQAEVLRSRILAVFDRDIHKLVPIDGYVQSRRQVIVKTLDEMVRLSADRPAP